MWALKLFLSYCKILFNSFSSSYHINYNYYWHTFGNYICNDVICRELKLKDMKTPTNINWASERELELLSECDDLTYSETDWKITFDYNGYKLFATLDFDVNLYEHGEEETNSIFLDVLYTCVTVKEILDENDDFFKIEVSEAIELLHTLQADLKIQF